MHEDMNGSAVALGILTAATAAKLKVNIDCWLALAQNHLSPRAYKQNDIVTALNGTTIEIVHTDAEGRMVLADTLTLAARAKPDVMVDFATLTGAMHVALGNRYSGIFATSDALAAQAQQAGVASGERICAFPMDEITTARSTARWPTSAMHARRRCRPYPRRKAVAAVYRPTPVDSHGPVGAQLQGRAGRGGDRTPPVLAWPGAWPSSASAFEAVQRARRGHPRFLSQT